MATITWNFLLRLIPFWNGILCGTKKVPHGAVEMYSKAHESMASTTVVELIATSGEPIREISQTII